MMLDAKQRAEAALRGAKIAQAALILLCDHTDSRTLSLVGQELAQRVLDLREFSRQCSGESESAL